ncbi:MAG: peptidoglycan-binding protein [Cyanobacteria bacterium P01_C01_bin.70]
MFVPLICDTGYDATAIACHLPEANSPTGQPAAFGKTLTAMAEAPSRLAQQLQAPSKTPQFSSPPPPLLGRSSQGREVMEVQSRLQRLGYDSGMEDGIFGWQTEQAVRRFQTEQGIAIDGIVGSQTRALLFPEISPPPILSLTRRSTGPAVKQLQTRLQQLGYEPGAIDGQFGPQSRAAVIQFQQAQGLNPDGIVGPETHLALESKQTLTVQLDELLEPLKAHPVAITRQLNITPPKTVASPQVEWFTLSPFLRPLLAIGGAMVFVAGWAIILRTPQKSKRQERSIDSQPALPIKGSKTPPILATQPVSRPRGLKTPFLTAANKSPILVATLLTETPHQSYSYSLVDDAGGLFRIIDDKLWMIQPLPDALDKYFTIVLRCTDSIGRSKDKIFEIAKRSRSLSGALLTR